jgi:lipid II isoglutaminyl synthase (glutamine-hydrolysing)
MGLYIVFGIWAGKFVTLVLRIMGRRATSLPGKVALKLSPKLLRKLGKQLHRCVVVTGTNGKTTTSALLAAMLQTEGPVIHNTEGANLPQGLASAFLQHTNWFGRLKYKTALLEIDEATLPLVASAFPIKVAVVTNVFRDQLDRYGELDTTLQKILQGLAQTEAVVLLNADDPLAHHIGLKSGRPVTYFGMGRDVVRGDQRDQMRDGAFCMQCGHELHYDGFFYGQLGLYKCPDCDFIRPMPNFVGEFDGSTLLVQQGQLPSVHFHLPVRGIFNLYNALCAIAAARVCGLDAAQITEGLTHFQAPLGRMQAFPTSPSSVLNLIKNPTGCDGVLQAITAEPGEKVLCVAINDHAADGRDVSWLWDADFELVAEDTNVMHCVTTGLRAEDMALRLKYAGYPLEQIAFVPELEYGLDEALEVARGLGNIPVYVVSTYTALYPLADALKRRVTAHEPALAHRASVS